jgi:hypothetical protein
MPLAPLSMKNLFITAGMLAVAAPAYAQNVPTRTLTKPEVEYSEPFTQISGIRELRDGRVITVDPRDKTVQVVDLRAGKATKLGREGSGPGEYGMPFGLMALPNDTTAVIDFLNQRLLLINPNATVGGFVDLNTPPPSGGRGDGVRLAGAALPRLSDSKGRMYYEGQPFQLTDEGPKAADSVPMIRWNRASGKRDTVAWRKMPQGAAQISGGRSGGGQNVSIRLGGGPPFAGADAMLVAPDGRVAVVRHDPFSVDYISETGQRTRGQPIRYEKVKVSDGHKEEWRERQRGATSMMMTNDNGRRSATMAPQQVQEPETWGGDFMPPFLTGTNNAVFSNDGYLWISRTGPAGQPPTYDIIDRGGNVVQRVVLPKRHRLLGFGNGTVYLARLDEDDLQYLQKHRFTMPDRP